MNFFLLCPFPDLIHMDVSVCWIQVWLMQRAGTLQTSDLQQGKLPWLQTSLTSWMARLSVSLAADAIRCLHGCQILLDTFKHKDVCWVVRCNVCATLSEHPAFLGAVSFYLELSTSNRQMCDWFAGYSFCITAQIRAVLEGRIHFLNWTQFRVQYLHRRKYIKILVQTVKRAYKFTSFEADWNNSWEEGKPHQSTSDGERGMSEFRGYF